MKLSILIDIEDAPPLPENNAKPKEKTTRRLSNAVTAAVRFTNFTWIVSCTRTNPSFLLVLGTRSRSGSLRTYPSFSRMVTATS